MMENGSMQVVDRNNDIVVDLDSWIEEVLAEDLLGSLTKSGVDATTVTPNYPTEPFMSTVNGGTDLGGSSSNELQSEFAQQVMTTATSVTPSSSTYTVQNEGILSSAVKLISNISAQSSNSQSKKEFPECQVIPPAQAPQCQPLLQQDYKGKAVQQPTTFSLANQALMTFGDLDNQLCYQMPLDHILPCSLPMVNYMQMQPNLNQSLIQLPQATWSSGEWLSGWWQQGNFNSLLLAAPVGFATPAQFDSSTAYHKYVLRQIRNMKDRYSHTLLKMHYNAMELRTLATNIVDKINYEKVQFYLERMMTFLSITRVELIPQNDEAVYYYMNSIVNYMSYHTNSPNGSVNNFGVVNMQNNTSPNPFQMVANLEPNMLTFNHNFPSRISHQQPTQSSMPSSLNAASFKAPQPSVLSTTQETSQGLNTSSVIGPGPPTSLFSNTTATNFPSRPLNHQPSVENQNLNLDKMKAPESSSRFDISSVVSAHSIERSTFLLSANSSAPSKQYLSGTSSMSTVDGQQTKTPTHPPSQEPKSSKDQVKSASSNALGSTLTNTVSIEKGIDIIPDSVPLNPVGKNIQQETNVMLEHDHDAFKKKRHESSAPSVYSDQFVSQESDKYSPEEPTTKKTKIENKWAFLEEIKDINSKLIETSINVVMDPSEDDIKTLAAREGTIVKCLYKNLCFADLHGPQASVTSEKMPEFFILVLVPANYPASSPRLIKSSKNVLNEPWGMLYEDMLTQFGLSLCWLPGTLSLGDVARTWDASARAVTTAFMKNKGGKGVGLRYGSWDNCINSSSTCN